MDQNIFVDSTLTPAMVDVLERISKNVKVINGINFVEDEVLADSRDELIVIAKLLEKYYLTSNSISALVTFLPDKMTNNIHVGAAVADKLSIDVISAYIYDKFNSFMKKTGFSVMRAEGAKIFYFSMIEQCIANLGKIISPKH